MERAESKRKRQKTLRQKHLKSVLEKSLIISSKRGKSIEVIAKERGLTPATIQGHLIPYIQKGDIQLNEVIDESKARTIQQKIKLAGKDANLKALKILCPANISYSDILLVMKTTML